MNLSLSCAFEEDNRAFVAPVQARLTAICADAPLHARFLNMLSLLEHIGSRKIMLSLAMATGGKDVLKHLAEETRHALYFKRAAEKIARRPLDYGQVNTVAGASARFYMGRLDAEITWALSPKAPALPYLYMSLIVELRAVWIYHLYETVLKEQQIPLSLKSVLAEEELHLTDMLASLTDMDRPAAERITLFSSFERAQFGKLWSDIEQECARPRLAAE
jgi:hypothetical protein